MMEITTNNVPRDVCALADCPASVRADFDYIEGDDIFSDRMVKYRGTWYDLNEYVRIAPRARAVGFEHPAGDGSPLLAWDGIATDSYFSATVVRYVDGGERVVMGRASW